MGSKVFSSLVLLILLSGIGAGAARIAAPEPVSPGSLHQVETVPGSCPTFSWSSVPGAAGYRLVVYEVTTEGDLGGAVLQRDLPGGTFSWTPPLRHGLAPGGSFAWTVGVVTAKGKTLWSEPALFRVAPGPTQAELEEALEVFRRFETPGRSVAGDEPVSPFGNDRQSSSAPNTNVRDYELDNEALVVEGDLLVTGGGQPWWEPLISSTTKSTSSSSADCSFSREHTFCSLSNVSHRYLQSSGTWAYCSLSYDSGSWTLCARSNGTTEISCTMTCFGYFYPPI